MHLDDATIEFTVNMIKAADLSQVDQSIVQIVSDAVTYQVDATFRGIYLQTVGLFALLLSVLLLEFLMYREWGRRQAPRLDFAAEAV